MDADYARFIGDEEYRKGFLAGLDRVIGMLQAGRHYPEMVGYCKIRERIEGELKNLRM